MSFVGSAADLFINRNVKTPKRPVHRHVIIAESGGELFGARGDAIFRGGEYYISVSRVLRPAHAIINAV